MSETGGRSLHHGICYSSVLKILIQILILSPLRKVNYSEFQCFLPLTPKGETLKFRIIQKSPLGDLGVK
jgi:hypothetical protein